MSSATCPTAWARRNSWSTGSTRCARPWASPMPTSTSCWPSRPSSRTRSTPPVPGTSSAPSRSPWTPSGSPGRRRCHHPVGRRASPGGAVPVAPLEARPAPSGRADQPPRRRVGGLAGTDLAGVPGHGGGRDPRPVLLGQRGRMDPRAGPGVGHSLGGQLLVVAGTEAGPAGRRAEGRPVRQQALQRELEWIRMSPRARQSKGKARINAYNDLVAEAEAAERRADKLEITIPAGSTPGRPGHRRRRPGQGVRRPATDRRAVVPAASWRHRRGHRTQRRRQDHAVPDDRGRGEARRRAPGGGHHGAVGLRRPVTGRADR